MKQPVVEEGEKDGSDGDDSDFRISAERDVSFDELPKMGSDLPKLSSPNLLTTEALSSKPPISHPKEQPAIGLHGLPKVKLLRLARKIRLLLIS